MNQRLVRFLKTLSIGSVAVTFLLASCDSKPDADDSTKAVAAAVKTPAPNPGDLPSDISTMSSADLATFAGTLTFDTITRQPRKCSGTPACNNPNARVAAQMASVQGQIPQGPTTIGAHGTIVARMQNLGGPGAGNEAKYGLRPGAQTFYYLIALPGTPTWSWTLRQVIANGNPQPPTEAASGAWTTCNHQNHPTTPVMFYSCSDSLSAVAKGKKLNDDPLSPGWMTCTDGCCTAGS